MLDYDVKLTASANFKRETLVHFFRQAQRSNSEILRLQIRVASDDEATDGQVVILDDEGHIIAKTN